MKQIVMLMGMGINERGWARLVSSFGRVVLFQQGFIEHVEVWEGGNRVYNGPERSYARVRPLDQALLNVISTVRSASYTLKFTKKQKINVIIAANHNCGLAALMLRRWGKAAKVVCFLTDYLPPRGSLAVRAHRRVTRWLSEFVAKRADEVWLLSPRIPTDAPPSRQFVVPICIEDHHAPEGGRAEIGYIGYPSPDHAIELLFALAGRHHLRVNIIGDSPYLQSIKHLAPSDTLFHGVTNDPIRINQILSKCFCGYAVYVNTGPQSYSYYGFPSKTLSYFANNVPIVTTNAAFSAPSVEQHRIGRVVEPLPEQIEKAILQMRDEYKAFYDAINRFREEWNENVNKFHAERLSTLLGP